MKKILFALMCGLLSSILNCSERLSGSCVAQRFGLQNQPMIDQRAQGRLQQLLDHPEDGLDAKLKKVFPVRNESGFIENISLEDIQNRSAFQKKEVEETARLAIEDVSRKAIIILKDFNVDAGNGAYEAYLKGEYARAIDQKTQSLLHDLHVMHQSELRHAVEIKIDEAKAESRPFRLGKSLFINVVKDAKEDLPKVATIAGACAVAMPYIPLKTREKMEDGVGTTLARHPASAVASLAALIGGWQIVKYVGRYFEFNKKVLDIKSQVKPAMQEPFYGDDTVKKIFIAQVPHILQSARESATVARLEHEMQGLRADNLLAQQRLGQVCELVAAQGLSLQSLQTFAQAHGLSLHEALRKLDDVRVWQENFDTGLTALHAQSANQARALQHVGDDVRAIRAFLEQDDSASVRSARQHRSASELGCSVGAASSVASIPIMKPYRPAVVGGRTGGSWVVEMLTAHDPCASQSSGTVEPGLRLNPGTSSRECGALKLQQAEIKMQ